MNKNEMENNDTDMTVDITIDDHTVVNCSIETIFEMNGKDYIALHPNFSDPNQEEVIWFYGYSENPQDPNEEPQLTYIADDEEYEAVCDAFDEWLDTEEFEDLD